MIQGKAIYEWVCKQADLETAVNELNDEGLRDLIKHLVQRHDDCVGGVPALVHGVAVMESSARFVLGVKAETLKTETLKSADKCHGSEVQS